MNNFRKMFIMTILVFILLLVVCLQTQVKMNIYTNTDGINGLFVKKEYLQRERGIEYYVK